MLHALLVKRTDDLEACTEGSDEDRELAVITDANEAHEAVRWPLGERKRERASNAGPPMNGSR
jgi:hypothetical protein